MEGKAAQPSRLDAMQQSLRLQPLRFLFLVIIFLQLYLSNSVSLPSIIGILLSCAVYAFYVDSKAKRSRSFDPGVGLSVIPFRRKRLVPAIAD